MVVGFSGVVYRPLMPCALGFRAHTGWTAVVAIDRDRRVIHRGRLDLIAGADAGQGHVFHVAAELASLAAAEKRIAAATAESASRARQGIASLVAQLDDEVVACGVVLGNPRPLPALEAILRSHALLHTAEGMLYRNALLEAARALRLRTLGVPAAQLAKHPQRKRIDALGRELGPPWAQDQKESALVAWLALSD